MKDDDFFWEAAGEDRLLVQRCAGCGLVRHPPAPMCGRCQSLEVEVIECSGRAEVVGWLISKHPTRPDDAPRIVARLRLEEGVYMISNLLGVGLAELHEGLPVTVTFQDVEGKRLPLFQPAGAAA